MAKGALFGVFRRHPLLGGAFALSALLAVFFAGRFVFQVIYWQAHAYEPVSAWMTPGYVARSWGVDPKELARTAGLPPLKDGKRRTIETLAAERGVPVETVIDEIEKAVEALKAASEQTEKP